MNDEDLKQELLDRVAHLLDSLATFHPISNPGMWDVTVDCIRAYRTTINSMSGDSQRRKRETPT